MQEDFLVMTVAEMQVFGNGIHTTQMLLVRVVVSPVAGIVRELCQVIWNSLVLDYMRVPKEEDWKAIARGLYS